MPIYVFSVHGITSDGGIYDLFQPCNEIISTMMQNSDKKVCLCDNSKTGKGGAFKICNVSDIDYIVCDRDISGAFTHPDTLSLIFQPLNFSTKKRQLNYILKKRETGDNQPIARFLLYYYVDYFTVTILFKTLKLTVFCLNGKTASEFNLMPFFAPPFSGYKTSNPKSA